MKKGLLIVAIVLLLAGCGVLGYFAYNLNEDSIKYKNEINEYKTEIQKLKTEKASSEQTTDESASNDCALAVKGSQYTVANSGNDGSNGEPVTEKTSLTFGNDNKVSKVAGTAAWEDSYSISGNVITFGNSGTKSYGIISQDCKTIYTIDTQLEPAVRAYQKN